MKQIFLSTLLCLVGYTGAYASNEVVNDLVISEEIETGKFKGLDSFELVFSDNNCFAYMELITPTGIRIFADFSTYATSHDDCDEQVQAEFRLYEEMGYTFIGGHGEYTG